MSTELQVRLLRYSRMKGILRKSGQSEEQPRSSLSVIVGGDHSQVFLVLNLF